MFETAEIGRSIDKATFEAEEPTLREALLELVMSFGDSSFEVRYE